MDPQEITAKVKQEAFRLGFELVGVTTPDPPPHLDVYQEWIQNARHGDMGYLATERALGRRADPRSILPECRSILAVGLRHAPPPSAGSDGIAAYALGVDYPRVIVPRLERLMRFLEPLATPPFTYRLYADTGPILERDLAQRAGLGWIGKNTCLIHPRHGSYFLLREALLSQVLLPDAPFAADRCGSCNRCVEACPTQCILPDRTIDARRCISYLTIENKGSIPIDLRPQIENWVFGCDICQQVCPWNLRFARPEFTSDLNPQPNIASPNLNTELHLTPQEFNRKFKYSPIQRAKRRGYLRNVAVALGNSKSPEAIQALAKTLQTEAEPLVRAHAAWALGQIGGQDSRTVLEECSQTEADQHVLAEIQAALINLSNPL